MNLSPVILGIGILGVLAGGILYLAGMTKKWGMLIPFSGMLLFGSMALPLTWNDQLKVTVWLPIQSQRSLLFLVCGILGFLVLLIQVMRLRGRSIPASAVLLLFAGLFSALLRFVHTGVGDGIESIAFSILTLLPLLVTSALVIERFEDLRLIFRAVSLVTIVWIGMVFVQIVVNPSHVTMGNEFRFVGLMSNPQHTGVLMAFLTVSVLWGLLNDVAKFRLIYLGTLGVCGVMLMWTGSRTGMGMTVIGVSAVLYSRAGKAILLLPLAGLVGYISVKVMVDMFGLTMGFERLTSTEDTRGDAWRVLIQTGIDNAVVGVGTDVSERSENSWLYGMAAYGVGMLVLLLIFTAAATIEIMQSFRTRFTLPGEYRPYIDGVIGIMLMYFAGAVLEGYMVSRVSATICIFMAASVANAQLRRLAKEQYGQLGEYEYGYEEYAEYAEYDDGQYPDELQY